MRAAGDYTSSTECLGERKTARARPESPVGRRKGEASVTTRVIDYLRDLTAQWRTTFHPAPRSPVPAKRKSLILCRRCSHTWTQKLYTSCCPSVILKVSTKHGRPVVQPALLLLGMVFIVTVLSWVAC